MRAGVLNVLDVNYWDVNYKEICLNPSGWSAVRRSIRTA